eukprot:1908891-Prymnesium_polylepis.1
MERMAAGLGGAHRRRECPPARIVSGGSAIESVRASLRLALGPSRLHGRWPVAEGDVMKRHGVLRTGVGVSSFMCAFCHRATVTLTRARSHPCRLCHCCATQFPPLLTFPPGARARARQLLRGSGSGLGDPANVETGSQK